VSPSIRYVYRVEAAEFKFKPGAGRKHLVIVAGLRFLQSVIKRMKYRTCKESMFYLKQIILVSLIVLFVCCNNGAEPEGAGRLTLKRNSPVE